MSSYSTANSFLHNIEGDWSLTPRLLKSGGTDRRCVAAIVMPAGTGKSFFRRVHPDVKVCEADELCGTRATKALDEFRTRARETGDWTLYDIEMSRELLSCMEGGDVIMVSSLDLAKAMNANIIGVHVLAPSRWRESVEHRGQNPEHYIIDYFQAKLHPMAQVFPGFSSLFQEVKKNVEFWKEYMSS